MKMDIAIMKQMQVQIAASDQSAFKDLYRMFFPRLFNFALVYVHTKEIAEEIVNDVMVKIWEKRYTINDIDNLETYLFVAARNHSLNYLKKYSHYHVSVGSESDLAKVINTNTPQTDLEWKEINFHLNSAVEQLPAQCRTVFKLIKEEGFQYRQVAEILGLSPRTVETQLFRAIKKLSAVINTHIDKTSANKTKRGPFINLLLFIIS